MFGLRIHPPKPLSKILEPFRDVFDSCWWYLGGHGASLPNPPDAPSPTPFKGGSTAAIEEWKRENAVWLADREKQYAEYNLWVDDINKYRVGIPGWFSRYIDYADRDWAIYYACYSAQFMTPQATLNWLHKFECPQYLWLSDPAKWLLPDEVIAVCRIIDNAYWDIFVRDADWRTTIRNHVGCFENVTCSEFREVDDPGF
jgi:hypothetical protein